MAEVRVKEDLTMKPTATANAASDGNRLASDIRRRIRQVVITLLILGALLFLSAGRLDWGMAWAYPFFTCAESRPTA